MTNDEMKAAILQRSGGMWADRAVSLIDVLDNTGIDPTSSTLLDEMIAAKSDHPKVATWLDNLPGMANGNRAKAEEQLGYLTMQINAVAA